jgi:hypothetical protein
MTTKTKERTSLVNKLLNGVEKAGYSLYVWFLHFLDVSLTRQKEKQSK